MRTIVSTKAVLAGWLGFLVELLPGMGWGYSSCWSSFEAIDATQRTGIRWAKREERVTWNTAWDDAARLEVCLERPNGERTVFCHAEAPVSGRDEWQSEEPGKYRLVYTALDADGLPLKEMEAVFWKADGIVHSGEISGDEIWEAGVVHVIDGEVCVYDGNTLTIEEGGIVKFLPGGLLYVSDDSQCIANGVVFTHIADDTVGGDTMRDGRETVPEDNKYSVSGNLIKDAATDMRYQTVTMPGGVISENTIWPGHRVIRLTNDVVVANGASLTIQPGAILKFSPGVSMSVLNKGVLNAAGLADDPIVFTSVKDDQHGGDTNGDGNSTVPGTNDFGAIYAMGAVNMEHCLLPYCSCQQVDAVGHAGNVSTNETWWADKVHVVFGTLTVGKGATLDIESGAVLKFVNGAGLAVSSGGGCVAEGVIFTHIDDDTVGGDTMMDGSETAPVAGQYHLTGSIVTDEATEMRWLETKASGTLSGENTWMGNRVIRVTGNLTVGNGAKLNILPGAIVKFDSGKSLTVNSGGTLNAIGTRAAPIVFTSVKDDEWGGDTNGDGDSTAAQPGDWARIYAGGTVNMEYCRIRHCNNNSDYGAIHGTGGAVKFDDGVIEHSVYECVRMNSGRFESRNSVFREASMGFGYYGGSGVYVYNGVVADCTIGCRASNKHFFNTVFYRCQTFLESTSSSCDHCLFFNPEGYGAQSASQAGSSGNAWGDPKFADADNGDFRIGAGSACIDAGEGKTAPEVDYYGQPRMDAMEVADTGTAAANGAVPDIGIHEYLPRVVESDVDLAVGEVVCGADAASIGGDITVSWTVENLGSAAAGTWRDVVELVAENGAVVALGERTASGLAAGGTRTDSGTFTVPAMAAGTARVRVKVNPYRDIFEGTLTGNNTALSVGTLDIQLPTWTAETAGRVALAAGGSAAFRIPAGSGTTALVIRGGGDGVSAWAAAGGVPSGLLHDVAAERLADGSLLMSLPKDAGEVGYDVAIENGSLDDAILQVEALTKTVDIMECVPIRLANTGIGHLSLLGTGLDRVAAVRLAGPSPIELDGCHVLAPARLSGTVDLSGRMPGTYGIDLVLEDGSILNSPLSVDIYQPKEGPKLHLSVSAPSNMRQHRWYEATVTLANDGDESADMPIIVLLGDSLDFLDPDGSVEIHTNAIHLLPHSAQAASMAILPGESLSFSVDFRSRSSSHCEIRYGMLNPDEAAWHSFVSQGTLSASDWQTYQAEWRRGFDSPRDFLARVRERATEIAALGGVPRNALRLYDVVQAEKDGQRTVVVGGCVMDESRQAEGGVEIGIGGLFSEQTVWAKTRTDGTFFAYGVEPGILTFATSSGRLVPEETVETEGADCTGVVLRHVREDESGEGWPFEQESGRQFNALSKLGTAADWFIWIDENDILCIGTASNGTLVCEGQLESGVGGYEWCELGDGDIGVVGMRISNLTNSLFGVRLAVGGASGARVGSVVGGPAPVTRLMYARPVNGNDVVAGYALRDEESGINAYYQATLTLPAPSGEATTPVSRHLPSARGYDITDHMDLDINDSWLLGIDLGKYGVGFGWTPRTDTGMTSSGDCGWHRAAEQEFRAGAKVGLNPAAGFFINGSGRGQEKWTYLCENAFRRTGDCSMEKAWMTAHSLVRHGGCEIGFQVDAPFNAESLIRRTHGTAYKVARLIPLTLNLSAKASVTVGSDSEIRERIVPSNGGAINYFHTIDDKWAIKVGIAGNAGVNVGLSQLEGGGGRGRTKRTWGISTSGTDEVPLDAHAQVSAHITREYIHHFDNWTFPLYGGGSAEVRFGNLFARGTLVIEDGAADWQWAYQWFDRSDSSENHEAGRASARRLRLRDGAPVPLFSDLPQDGDLTLALWNVLPVPDSDAVLLCREFMDGSTIRKGLFLKVDGVSSPIRVSSDGLDVLHARPVSLHDGSSVVFQLACTPDFGGDAEDLLASYSEVRLYSQILAADGTWQDAQPVFDDANAVQGAFQAIAIPGTDQVFCVFLNRSFSTDGGTATDNVRFAVLDTTAGAILREGIVPGLKDRAIVSATLWEDNGGICAGFAVAATEETEADEFVLCQFDGAEITPRGILTAHVPTPVGTNQIENVQGKDVGDCCAAKNPSPRPSCGTSCRCRCKGPAPKPVPGCACPIYCKCEGLCPLGQCKCGKQSHHASIPKSCDPNEMGGPAGVGERRLVGPGEWMTYAVYFENAATAETAAQEVRVALALDPGLDWNTFEFGEVVFGEQIDKGLHGKKRGTSEVQMDGTNYWVRTEAEFDEGTVNWYLRIVDRATADRWPKDLYAGILPPNDETGRGEGHLTYRVKVREDAAEGAVVRASAGIVFDYNEAIETDPSWWNTVTRAKVQEIVFPEIGPQTTADTVELWASASSGLPVSYEVSGPATLDGDVLTFTGTGTVTVTARQDGEGDWEAAEPVTVSFEVGKAVAVVELSGLERTYDGEAKAVGVSTTPAGLTVGVTYDGDAGVPTDAGRYAVEATVEDDLWKGSASGTLVIAKGSQIIEFAEIGAQTVTNEVVLGAVASSGLAVAYEVTSGPGVIAGNMLTFTGGGTVTVRASQAGDANWEAAASVEWTVEVAGWVTVTVASAHGTAAPGAGTHEVVEGSRVEASVSGSPEALGEGLRAVFTGWRLEGEGVETEAGEGTSVSFTATGDMLLTWVWETQALVRVEGLAHGTAEGGGWFALGSQAVLAAVPEEGHEFTGWEGDFGASRANPWTLTVTKPGVEVATFYTTYYAGEDGDDGLDGLSRATAKREIAAALAEAAEGDTVIAGPGTYGAIDVPAAVTVFSEEGAEKTFVRGAAGTRCATVGEGSQVTGFTFEGGDTDGDGGGALLADGAVLRRCVLRGNRAGGVGGGAKGGLLENCLVVGNEAAGGGGGASGSVLRHCTVVRNAGGGAKDCQTGCSVFGENDGGDVAGGATAWSLCNPAAEGQGNIKGDPCFAGEGDWRLAYGSPCIDAAGELTPKVAVDLAGAPRPQPKVYGEAARADMGCYEYVPKGRFVWAEGRGVPPYETWGDAAKDIQSALDVSGDGDRVVVEAGVYAGPVTMSNAVVLIGFRGAGETVIDAGRRGRGVTMEAGGVLEGFTVRGGVEDNGSGIWADGGAVVRNVTVEGCGHWGSVSGGGVFLSGRSLAENVTAVSNRATYGGGVYATGTSVVHRCVLTGNTGDAGGGAWLEEGSRLLACKVSGNKALAGGGVCSRYGDIAECELTDNSSEQSGGGADVGGGTFFNNIVSGNSALWSGGGLRIKSALGHDCLVIGNTAGIGGGVWAEWEGELWNFTVVGNVATNGVGGVYLSEVSLGNSIVWGNEGGNLTVRSGALVRHSCSSPAVEGEGNIGEDPQFVGEGDYHLRAGSPCVDAGEVREWMGEAHDFDGQRRVEIGEAGDGRDVWVDIGVDEAAQDAVGAPSGAGGAWTWRVVPDARLQLQRTTGLTGAAAWEDAGESFTATNGVWTIEEPFEGTGARFYRLIWLKE